VEAFAPGEIVNEPLDTPQAEAQPLGTASVKRNEEELQLELSLLVTLIRYVTVLPADTLWLWLRASERLTVGFALIHGVVFRT